MEKKEAYRNMLPHFQKPGQAYFVTWNLKIAVPPKALKRYSSKLEILKLQLNSFSKTSAGNSVSSSGYGEFRFADYSNSNWNSRHPNSSQPLSPETEKIKRNTMPHVRSI